MEAIILAGGFGTRLNHIVSSVPKPMAPVNDRPFLVYILDYLAKHNFKKIILAVGYKSECIKDYFKNSYKNMEIIYSNEDVPLGTGGAIKKAISKCESEKIFIFNGDTFFDVDLKEMDKINRELESDITIAVKQMFNYDRYGSVFLNEYREVIKFSEKKHTEKGFINGGVYLIDKAIFNNIYEDSFSFESDILESLKYKISAFESEGYFIDIGIPDDYEKAQKDFYNER